VVHKSYKDEANSYFQQKDADDLEGLTATERFEVTEAPRRVFSASLRSYFRGKDHCGTVSVVENAVLPKQGCWL
jgi:hypothetical protein